MKKITLFCFALLLPLGIMAQTLPLDFEVPEDDGFSPFNGATATVVVDPTDSTNSVLELTSNGADFDGAAITLATFIDLSDDNNNTITLEFWAPDATTRTHLLKVEGATNGPAAAELFFDTTAAGWQTVQLDFGPGLADNYPILVLFADSGAGNTATGTYYIDDINGTNGAVVPVTPVPSEAAPVPTAPDSEVYSIYNDTNGYSTTFPFAYSFGTLAGTPDLDPTATENRALQFNFGVAGYGEGEALDDVSSYGFLSFNYWAEAGTTGFNVELISNDGGVVGYIYEFGGANETIVTESWQTVSIPMSTFTNQGFSANNFFQWKFDPYQQSVNNAFTVYVDNIMFTQNPLSTDNFDVTDFSVYPNPTTSVWNIETNNANIQTVEIFNTLGRLVKTVEASGSEISVDASELSSGIYFAKVNSQGNAAQTIKLIKK